MPPEIEGLASQYLVKPVKVKVGKVRIRIRKRIGIGIHTPCGLGR
jgi:hypothetical protein